MAASTQSWWWTAQAIRAAPFVTAYSAADDFQGSLGRLRSVPPSRLAGQLHAAGVPVGGCAGGPAQVALAGAGGQSAGAALVAGACLLARDHHRASAACQVLCYPVLDFGQDTESARLFNGVFHSIKPGSWAEDQYLAGQPVTEYAGPLRAASLAGLPPALVIGAGHDPLRDDARAYAARMDADGVDVTHVEYDATMHAFRNFAGVLSAADHEIELIAATLAAVLAGPPDR